MQESKMSRENISLNYESRRSCNSINILVVDDDTTCLSFVAALLKKLKYEVVTAKHPKDALCALRIKGGAFDLVVSDIHMPDMNGFELQQAIAHEFNLPVVLMSVDNKEVVVSEGMKNGAAFFISKPVSPNDLKDLWQFAATRKKSSHVLIEENNCDAKSSASTLNEGKHSNSKRKPASKEGGENTKKPKVIWTNALHYRFLEAIRTIGLERSVPKKILEVMNVPGLTRENVASHLQKYRMFLKRVSDASYKLELGDDESSINRSCLSNYASPTSSNSLLMLKRLQEFGGLPAANMNRFSYQENPSVSLVHQSLSQLRHHQLISIGGGRETSSQAGKEVISDCVEQINQANYVGYDIKSLEPDGLNELQNNIVNQDQQTQYFGDFCFEPNRPYHDNLVLPQQLDLPLIEDLDKEGRLHETAISLMYDLPPIDPLMVTDFDNNVLSDQVNVQNLAQNGCDYTASSIFYGGVKNSSYEQAIIQREEEDVLESLLAFGEDQIQTLDLDGI